jgi:hypothetical protein
VISLAVEAGIRLARGPRSDRCFDREPKRGEPGAASRRRLHQSVGAARGSHSRTTATAASGRTSLPTTEWRSVDRREADRRLLTRGDVNDQLADIAALAAIGGTYP